MEMEVIRREIIKPSSSTPHHLRSYKLSARDQHSPLIYIQVLFFYTAHDGSKTNTYKENEMDTRCQLLKESLSETLTRFYPLAGRLRADNVSVDCNDEGADYLEARVIDLHLSDILERPQVEDLGRLVPSAPTTDFHNAPLLAIRVDLFPCGGMAVGVSMSHKVADGISFASFIQSWSNIASHDTVSVVVRPDFTAASSRFPPREDTVVRSITLVPQTTTKFVAKRFLVEASKVATLKASTTSKMVPQPTRVEAVTALVWKCAIRASRSSRSGTVEPSYTLIGGVDLRPRLVPPLPEHSFGNINGVLWAVVDKDDDDYSSTELSGMVRRLREGVEKSNDNDFTDKVGNLLRLKGEGMEVCTHSSWCRFALYGTDFGWGKPSWVANVRLGMPVGFLLMDARDGGGVEVWATLTKEDMELFEDDPELLAFASPNPSAI